MCRSSESLCPVILPSCYSISTFTPVLSFPKDCFLFFLPQGLWVFSRSLVLCPSAHRPLVAVFLLFTSQPLFLNTSFTVLLLSPIQIFFLSGTPPFSSQRANYVSKTVFLPSSFIFHSVIPYNLLTPLIPLFPRISSLWVFFSPSIFWSLMYDTPFLPYFVS